MAYPETTTISYSYTGFAQSLGDASFPGSQIDTDFANILATLNSTVAFIQGSFRSDGYLRADKLPNADELSAYVTQAGEWADASNASAVIAGQRAVASAQSAQQANDGAVAAGLAAAAAAASAGSIDVSGFMQKSANLSDLTDIGAARTALGIVDPPPVTNIGLSQLAAAVVAMLVPPGAVQAFAGVVAPAGWMKASGTTIGGPGSGASAMGDSYRALYDVLWATPGLAITTNTGAASTRGATSAEDWTAGKRLATPDLRGEFIRGLDDGRAVDAGRVAGSYQGDLVKAHTHTVSVTGTAASAGAHTHTIPTYGNNPEGTAGVGTGMANNSTNQSTSSAGAHTHNVSATGTAAANVGTENRPRNVALLICIKL